MKINDILSVLDAIAPFDSAEEWDNSGVMVDCGRDVKKIGITLDITRDAVLSAKDNNVDLVISHHPVIFHPLSSVSFESPVYSLIQNGVSAIACHTNFDNTGRLNLSLAEKLGLSYLKDIDGGWGIICSLGEPTDVLTFAKSVKERLGVEGLSYAGNKKEIKNIAISTGSAFEDVYKALSQGADGILTSDVKHSGFIDACNMDFAIVSADHYDTEKIFCVCLYELLKEQNIDADVVILPQTSPQRHI